MSASTGHAAPPQGAQSHAVPDPIAVELPPPRAWPSSSTAHLPQNLLWEHQTPKRLCCPGFWCKMSVEPPWPFTHPLRTNIHDHPERSSLSHPAFPLPPLFFLRVNFALAAARAQAEPCRDQNRAEPPQHTKRQHSAGCRTGRGQALSMGPARWSWRAGGEMFLARVGVLQTP